MWQFQPVSSPIFSANTCSSVCTGSDTHPQRTGRSGDNGTLANGSQCTSFISNAINYIYSKFTRQASGTASKWCIWHLYSFCLFGHNNIMWSVFNLFEFHFVSWWWETTVMPTVLVSPLQIPIYPTYFTYFQWKIMMCCVIITYNLIILLHGIKRFHSLLSPKQQCFWSRH